MPRKLSKTFVSSEVFFIDGFLSETKCRDILTRMLLTMQKDIKELNRKLDKIAATKTK